MHRECSLLQNKKYSWYKHCEIKKRDIGSYICVLKNIYRINILANCHYRHNIFYSIGFVNWQTVYEFNYSRGRYFSIISRFTCSSKESIVSLFSHVTSYLKYYSWPCVSHVSELSSEIFYISSNFYEVKLCLRVINYFVYRVKIDILHVAESHYQIYIC